MKPHVTCHMLMSVDGRILSSRWRPKENRGGDLFERLHEKLGGGSWLVGRVTGQEFAKGPDGGYPDREGPAPARETRVLRRDAKAYAVVLDAHGKIAWGMAEIDGDPIVVVLTQQVSDAHLKGLEADGVSWIFAGEAEVDLAAALETLNRELGIERLMMEGGGGANGAVLRAGLIDALSLVVCPVVDGARGAPSVFDSDEAHADAQAPVAGMTLQSCETLDGGFVWLRYTLQNG
ncbi:MAG: RibD family protein [Caulobacteraceae bacterium]|nr:RibD family protein [Caulobacter sp.]